MALSRRIKQGFLRMPSSKKVVLVSSGLLMLSAFLPWYDMRNAFGSGDTYLGIQGSLFLVGALVGAFGAVSFFNLFLPLMGKNFFRLRRKSGLVAMLLGAQSLFLLLIANSVFFHPDFGANVSQKSTRFGMVVAFASLVLMVGAGYLAHRRERDGEYDEFEYVEEVREPEMPVMEPVASTLEQPYAAPSPNRPSYAQDSYTAQRMTQVLHPEERPAVRNSAPAAPAAPSTGDGVDPLTMDAKTRYKLMRQRQRMSQAAQSNMWGQGGGSNLPG